MPQLPDNFLFLNYPTDKHFILDPQLKAIDLHASLDGKTITFTLTTQAVAPFVFLNLRDQTHGHFSDNGFIMVKPELEMTYYSRDTITLEDFTKQLDITSLFDVTPFAVDIHVGDDHDNCVCIGVSIILLILSVVISSTECFL